SSRRAARARVPHGAPGRRALRSALERIADVLERTRLAIVAVRDGRRRRERLVPNSVPNQATAAATTGRRVPKLLVAGLAAGAVVVGGVLWPGGETGQTPGASSATVAPTSSSQQEASSETAPSATAPSDADGPPESDVVADPGAAPADPTSAPERAADEATVGAEEDPVKAAEALLSRLAQCRRDEDAVCPEAVAEGSAGVVDALGAFDEKKTTVDLVDSYGDVAVVRLSRGSADADAENPDEFMLVLVRLEEKWLVRDVYGVADQPG
ncbi:MAG: hypothetical protein QM568_11230, partial [Microbacterium sp.]